MGFSPLLPSEYLLWNGCLVGFYELILSTNTLVQARLLVSSGALVKTGWGKTLPNQKVVVLCSRCAWGKMVTLCTRQGEIAGGAFSAPWASVAGCDGLSCAAAGWCGFCLSLIRKVTKALSLLTFEEPVNSGGMLSSIQVLDFNGSEWKLYGRKLRLILSGSWVKCVNTSVPILWSCRISLMASSSQPSSPAMAPRDESPREGSQEHLLLPCMPSGSTECFMGCFALVLTFLFTCCPLQVFLLPFYFSVALVKREPWDFVRRGWQLSPERGEMLQMVAEESM